MNTSPKVPITVNVISRGEGIILFKSLRNIVAGIDFAKSKEVDDIQLNVCLIDTDDETRRVVAEFSQSHNYISILNPTKRELNDYRNFLLSKSNGEYVVLINSGDLLSENFLYEAYLLAQKNKEASIYSVEFCVGFGDQEFVYRKPDFNSQSLNLGNIIENNYFDSPLFVSFNIYKKIRFLPTSSGSGEDLEAWRWSCDAISEGYKILSVPETIFFKRQSNERQNFETGGQIAAVGQSALFQPKKFIKLQHTLTTKTSLEAQKREGLESRISMDKAIKKRLIFTLKRLTNGGSSTTYHFVRDQYFLNRRYIAYLMSRASTGLGKKGDKKLLKIIEKSQKEGSDTIPQKLTDIGINMNTLTEWAKANRYEPMIRPSQDTLDKISVYDPQEPSILANKYFALCEACQDIDFTDLVLVNHLVKGGADLAAINLVKVLSNDLRKRVLVFTTDNAESPWAGKLSTLENVTLFELKDYCEELSDELKMKFVLKILQNWGINRLSIINSPFGYELLRVYGKAINDVCKVFLHAYAYDMTEDGFIFNVIRNGLVNAYPYVDLFVTDSKSFKDKLIEVNGFRDEKVRPIYLPIKNDIKPSTKEKNTNKVLWASRISHAKLVEVAVAVAALIESEGIELHFYGVIDPEYKRDNLFKKLIKGYANITYHGAYDGFANIDHENYDIFLLTSKNEGMPNIILEAVMANLFIVSANVGGIPELITEGENGFLVEDNFYPQEYAQKIADYYKNSKLWDSSRRAKINNDIIKKHSWAHYKEDINNLYGQN